ncbi:MAG: DUF4382 domain-containing protein [Halobacterium sp.]
MSRTALSLLVASLVVLAGCAGGIAGPGAGGTQTGDSTTASSSGTVSFYVSDEKNAIEDFEHLNVTITKVGFKTAGDAEAEGDADANATTTTTTEANTTTTNTTTTTTTTQATTTQTTTESDVAEESEDSSEWVEREVDSRTVDLTELQGANATLLGNLSVPAGEYTKTFAYVSDVEGTLKSGEQVNVKLPSQKLHLNEDFEVSSESSVEFVFDITVFAAGNSGKYILKPVASESGTDVPIEPVGGDDSEAEAELDVSVVGNATAGENATVKVTRAGEAVANATLTVDGEVVATTDANGTATVHVPESGELEVTASVGGSGDGDAEAEGELELELGDGEHTDGDDSAADNETDASPEAELAVALRGTFAANESVTVVVTDGDGDPVEDATVRVGGEVVGETNADGELTFTVPGDVTMRTDVTVTADGESVTVDASTVAAAN